jgi:hypothetical protein
MQMREMGTVTQDVAVPFNQSQTGFREAGEMMAEGGTWDAHTGLDVSNRGAVLRALDDEPEDGKAHWIPKGLETARVHLDFRRHDHLSMTFWLFRNDWQDRLCYLIMRH